VIRLKFQFCGEVFNIVAAYRLHQFSINSFNDELQQYFLLTDNAHKNCIFLGDINIDLLLLDSREVDSYKIIMASFSFESLINQPTRVTDISKTCIDHVFVRLICKNSVGCNAEVVEIQVTDHYLTALCLSCGDDVAGPGGRSSVNPASHAVAPTAATRICYDQLDEICLEL